MYWYDCNGARQSLKMDCGSYGCVSGSCFYGACDRISSSSGLARSCDACPGSCASSSCYGSTYSFCHPVGDTCPCGLRPGSVANPCNLTSKFQNVCVD